LAIGVVGGFGAARLGTKLLNAVARFGERGPTPPIPGGALRGMGGGALGFSKLPSWFCGKRGLAGGDIMGV